MKPLTDHDPMPFGKHKGTRMMDVPASYLHWLWTKEDGLKKDMENPVADYIRRNKASLEMDNPDLIW